MKRFIILSLTVAGGLYAQTSSPGGQERDKTQHRSKLESKTSTTPCCNKSLLYLS